MPFTLRHTDIVDVVQAIVSHPDKDVAAKTKIGKALFTAILHFVLTSEQRKDQITLT